MKTEHGTMRVQMYCVQHRLTVVTLMAMVVGGLQTLAFRGTQF
jgi:hypothetical protein